MANTPTSNHSYNKPAEGDTDWDTTLNNNFDAIDLDVTVVDTAANITTTNYTPDGQIAVASDTGEVFYGNAAGPSWDSLGAVGSASSSSYTTNASIPSGEAVTVGPDTVINIDLAGSDTYTISGQLTVNGSMTLR